MKYESYYGNSLENAKGYIQDPDILNDNKTTLLNYFNALQIGDKCKPASPHTIRGAVFVIASLGKFIRKDYYLVEKQDIVNYLANLKNNGRKPSTLGYYSLRIKLFYIWLKGEESKELIGWIKRVKFKRSLDSSKLYTPADIKLMLNVIPISRDRALVSGLYEGGMRLSEWINVKLKDIIFDSYGIKVCVDGKTGSRNIRLIQSVPYIHQWINEHPYKNNQDSYLFINFSTNYYGKPLHKARVGTILRMYSKRAGIKKYVHPHLFRHSKLNWLAQNEGFNERDLRTFAGWSATSDMPNTYLHYGEEEVDRKLRLMNGIDDESPESKESIDVLKPIICPRCKQQNPVTSKFCNCGMVLDEKEAMNLDAQRNEAMEKALQELMKIIQDPSRLEKFNLFREQFKRTED